MKKTSQSDIEALLAEVTEEEFLGFAKEYFGTHTEMQAAFRKRFTSAGASEAAEFDCKKEVSRCYRHKMKQVRWERDWSYQPAYLDWEAVGKDLRRLVSRVEAFAAEKPELALETAFLVIKTNSVQYEDEFLGEREDWDESDFCTGECVELIRKAFRSPELTAKQILDACDRLERLLTSPVFSDDDYGCEDLLYETRRGLVSDDEYLEILKRSFRNAESWQKEGAACEVWDFLVEAGREQEAVEFFGEHGELEELRRRYVEEGLLDRLYQHLMTADRCLFDGIEHYAKLFDKQKQGSLVSRLERGLKSGLGYNPSRKTYKDLAARLKRLSKICPAGRQMATEVRNYYLVTYPNRPALREEMEKVKW
jgi:hypothetical protein